MKRVLNVGGGTKTIAIPSRYEGWDHVLLDIDPLLAPDVLADARELTALPPDQFDAIYCSHNLEHYFPHDVPRVLNGFLHVLKSDGFAEIYVPDVGSLMRVVAQKDLDVTDILYESDMGPVRVHDVLYGYGPEIERSGQDFFAHKSGFTKKSLAKALKAAGFFVAIFNDGNGMEVGSIAFKSPPTADQRLVFNLP